MRKFQILLMAFVFIFIKLFEPFFTTKELDKGKGLGLTVSYSLVKELNGTIKVKNTDFGVEFDIKLPMLRHPK